MPDTEAAAAATSTTTAGVVHISIVDVYGQRRELDLAHGAAAELVRQVNRRPGRPSTGWLLDLGDGIVLSRAQAKKVRRVEAEQIETALAVGKAGPHGSAPRFAFGLDADEQLVRCPLPATPPAGQTGERAAAVAWLSGAPQARWRRVQANTPEAQR